MQDRKYSHPVKELWRPDVLVLGPGGFKSLTELGALNELENNHFLDRVKTYVGVSAGALISLLLVSGYTPKQIITQAITFDLFHDVFKDFTIEKLKDVEKKQGILPNNSLKEKLESMVQDKFGVIPTLKGLYNTTGLKLVTVTLNIDISKVCHISHETDPDISCVEAVLLSTNIPIVFQKIKYKGHAYIDGALGDPYPIDKYDDGIHNVLGLYIFNNMSSENIGDYFRSIIEATITQLRLRSMEKLSERCKHIGLNSILKDSTGLGITADQKVALILDGEKAASNFITNNLRQT